MRDPRVIGPTDARVVVTTHQMSPGLRPVFDRTDVAAPDDREPVFAVLDDGSPPAERVTAVGQPESAVLLADAERACRWRTAGWTGPVVVEVALDEGISEVVADLRRRGELVGVVVPSSHVVVLDEPCRAAAHGRIIGLLAGALLAGVATIRTDDPTTARRVRAIIAALGDPEGDDARMGR